MTNNEAATIALDITYLAALAAKPNFVTLNATPDHTCSTLCTADCPLA